MIETMEKYQFHCKKLINDGLTLDELNKYSNFKDIFSLYEFQNILKEKQNRKNKRYRTKNKFLKIYHIAGFIENSKIVFGTITLNDKSLKLKENTYIRHIHKWLKKHFVYVILNKDYGTKNEREHYHFIGLTTEELERKKIRSKKGYEIYELKNKDYTMGFEPTLCLIDLQKADIQKTTNYLLKLNNHSNKKGTKSRIRVIKGPQYTLFNTLTGFEPTRAQKRAKKDILFNAI